MEQRLRHLASNLGFNPLVAPLTVEGLEADAHARGDDPGSAEARSAYGAELVSTGHTILWPPGRNDPCWCGSGRKYKRCCGAPR
jgi:SEC-C motif